MAANITITSDGNDLGPDRAPAGKIRERLKLVGSSTAAADTGTVTPSHIHKNAVLLGGSFYISAATETIAGTALTVTSLIALGSQTVYVEIEGDV